ncbi:hypothetical protein FGO68_gene17348 [Halteria grandinella]|uniref:Uncharacterized protein n=1 Tax=Halteria grandinella TaxID=5974 RepID=A0A8J8P888_HALGN|nr:hypothetical protein FGO68_gene17348 [Halteria grandinella]
MFKLLLVITFKLRDVSFVLIYSLAAVTAVVCGYRLYLLLLKSHMFDDTVYRISILFDFGIIHLLFFFILTAVNQGQDYYLVFVVCFLPITCISGFFVKERCKKIWLSQLMNDTMQSEGEQLLCFLYLIFLYTQETDDSWQQLIRLQQLHYTRCEQFFNSIEKKMLANLQVVRVKQRLKLEQDAIDNAEFLEGEALLKHDDTIGEKSNHHRQSYREIVHAQSQGVIGGKKDGVMENQLRKSLLEQNSLNGERRGTVFAGMENGVNPDEIELEIQDLTGRIGLTQAIPNSKARSEYENVISDAAPGPKTEQVIKTYPTKMTPKRNYDGGIGNPRRSSKYQNQHSIKQFESGYIKGKGKDGKAPKTVTSNNMSELFSSSQDEIAIRLGKEGSHKRQGFQAKAFDIEIKKDLLRKLVRHYFNSHLLDDQQMGFQLKLVKIYFTYKILKNHYLAHFLLFSYQEDEDSEGNNFIISNQRLLNQRYIDELISIRQLQEVETNRNLLGQVNLLGLLRVNQLLVEFDNQLERISNEILDFWENLVNSRETVQIFTQGIKISDYLKEVQTLLSEIQEKQSDSESKIYLQMAQFYGQVVFKSFESMQMLDKARIAIQVKKLSKMTQERSGGGEGGSGQGNSNDNQEKCLLMAHISLKKPMKITFINKAALKMLQYSMNEALQLSINNIMPRAISEMHAKFLDQFMLTGKTRMLTTKREIFIKQRCGNVVPVFTYLFVNNMSRKHMILMFEPNTQFKVFDDPQHNNYYSFLLASKDFKLGELSQTFDKVTGVTNSLLSQRQEELDRQLQCDDLIRMHSQDYDLQQLDDFIHEGAEAEVTFKIENQRYQMTVDSYNEEYNQEYQIMAMKAAYMQGVISSEFPTKQHADFSEQVQVAIRGSKDIQNVLASAIGEPTEYSKKQQTEKFEKQSSYIYNASSILTPVFIMKVITLPFIDGMFELKLLAFRRKYNCFITGTGEYFQPQTGKELSLQDKGMSNGMYGISNDFRMVSGAQNSQSEGQLLGAMGTNEDSIEDHNYYDLASRSSTGSFSSQSTTVSVFSTYTQQVNSNVTPKTLKFILNMVLIIILVMIVASSLILSISMGNLSRAEISIEVNKHSFEAIDGMTTIRLLLRSLANIYQGYQLRRGEYMADRSTHYEAMILDINEQMRDDANFVANMADGSLLEISQNIQCGFLSAAGNEFIMNQSLSQGVNLLVSKVQDVIKATDREQIIGKSLLPFLNFGGLTIGGNKTAAYIKSSTFPSERDAYFVLNNTNGDLHYKLKSFGTIFSQQKIDEINSNVTYLSGMALGVIAVILLSGFLVIPLFGKIQNRILELMKLFFAIDIKIKKSTIERIEAFQRQYFKGAKDEKYRAASVSSFDEIESQNVERVDIQQSMTGRRLSKKPAPEKSSLALPSTAFKESIASPNKKFKAGQKVIFYPSQCQKS